MPATLSQHAVFGHPISHSLSPRIQAAFGQQRGIALEYLAIDATPDEFSGAVAVFFAAGGRGANVTLPHKGAAYQLAAKHGLAARRAGAANVLSRRSDGQLVADNTDGSGLIRDLAQRHGIKLASRRALLLGAGGAAYGVAWNLHEAGLAELVIVNRSPAKAQALADKISQASVGSQPWSALDQLGRFDLVIHATAAGVLAAPLALPASLVDQHSVCYDLSYGPAALPFLNWAKDRGAGQAIDGLGMLVETAADSFELWHGQRPETDPVYAMLTNPAGD